MQVVGVRIAVSTSASKMQGPKTHYRGAFCAPRSLGPLPFGTSGWAGWWPGWGQECQAACGEGWDPCPAPWGVLPCPSHLLTPSPAFPPHLPQPHSARLLSSPSPLCPLVPPLRPLPWVLPGFLPSPSPAPSPLALHPDVLTNVKLPSRDCHLRLPEHSFFAHTGVCLGKFSRPRTGGPQTAAAG